MQSYWMQMTDTATELEVRDVPVPEPGPGQLLVRIRAASLNRGEFLRGHGTHGKPGTWKAIGNEAAGEVVAAGAQARGFRAGDRVMGRCSGGFAEYALMESAEAMAVPPGVSFEEASAIPLVYLVAGMLEPFSLNNVAPWAVALRDAGADVVMTERVGSHGDAFWTEEFPLMAAWAFGH